MRTAREPARSDQFLGVRLTSEELERLDRFRARSGSPTRSDAVRALVRDSERTAPEGPELPVALLGKLEELVEDGWVPDLKAAASQILTLGLGEFERLHNERLPKLRQTARDGEARRKERRRMDREGRDLLEG